MTEPEKKPEVAPEQTQDNVKRFPVVIADIGGTNVRLSLLNMAKDPNIPPVVLDKTKLSPKDYETIDKLMEEYCSKFQGDKYPLYAVIGVPGPVKDNVVMGLVNIPHWGKRMSGDELAAKLKIKKFIFLNDFACNSYGIQTNLKLGEDYVVINDAPAQEGGAKAIIGPGTGLGMGFLLKDPANEYYTIGSSEGGHQDFTPKTKKMMELREFMMKELKTNIISVEKVVSGQSLILMYKYLLQADKNIQRHVELGEKIDAFTDYSKSEIVNQINFELVEKGLGGKCDLCKKVLELFIEAFGEASGDISLFCLPTNGIYLTGGMSIALESMIKSTNIFMEHFLNKESGFVDLLKTFPVYLVKNGDLGMLGATECARRLLKNEN